LNEERFFQQAKERLSKQELEAFTNLFVFGNSNDFDIKWGTGKETGSFTIVESESFSKSIISCYANGSIVLSFGGLKGSE